jgi:hypothetical protein
MAIVSHLSIWQQLKLSEETGFVRRKRVEESGDCDRFYSCYDVGGAGAVVEIGQ